MSDSPTESHLDLAGNYEGTKTLGTATTAATTAASENNGKKNAGVSEAAEKKKQQPIPVLATEFTETRVALRDAWVATFRDKRDISSTMKILSNILPCVSHLKRCSGSRLILAFASPDETSRELKNQFYPTRQELEDFLSSNGLEASIVFHEEITIVGVPASPPRTKSQACAASKIWPTNFHPDPSVERILSGRWFDSEDLERIRLCMEAGIEAATREARGNEECDGSAIAFDPIRKKIVAVAASRIDRHPMWHAAILAIDLVARLAGDEAGAYELISGPDDDERTEENTNSGGQIPRKRKHSVNRDTQSLAYPADLIDIVDRYAPRLSGKTDDRATSTTGYLCTDYWIFLLQEPCPLCAMALLHSRVSNVFYGVANERRGVLGSRALLHATPGLNHRYRVWRGVCEERCRETLDRLSLRVRT